MTIILMVKDYFLRIFNYIWCSFEGISFVEYLTTEYEVKGIKEAKSGTTLAGDKSDSYVNRLKKLNFVNTKLMQ